MFSVYFRDLAGWHHFFPDWESSQGSGGHSGASFSARKNQPSLQDNVQMLAVFRALTPKIFGIGLLPCELLLTLLHTQLLVFLAGWSLSLSIRATIGPRINKQSIWLEQHTPQEMKANEIADENLPQELWMGHLFHKTMPRTYESQSK